MMLSKIYNSNLNSKISKSYCYLMVKKLFFFRKLESTQLNSLRASSNGLLDIFMLLSQVVEKFEIEHSSSDYDHF